MESPGKSYIWVAVLSDPVGTDWRHAAAASRSEADLSTDFSGANLRIVKVAYPSHLKTIHVIARFFDEKTHAILTYFNEHAAQTEFKNAVDRHATYITKDRPHLQQVVKEIDNNVVYSTIYDKLPNGQLSYNSGGGRWIYFPDISIID